MSGPTANVFAPTNKRIIRSEPNEYDKATIVSIYPRDIKDTKATIFPGKFIIPAGSVAKPTILLLGPSSWFRDMGDETPCIEIPNNAAMVANSLVRDYIDSLMMVDKTQQPGVFFVPGIWNLKEIKEKFAKDLAAAEARQTKWYHSLLKLADHGWAVTNGSPKAISDLMRLAAEELGQTNRDWMKSTLLQDMIKCVLCGNLRNPSFPVCSSCNRVVDTALAKTLGLIDDPNLTAKAK